jgi:NitT/TauT family transport system permease protein
MTEVFRMPRARVIRYIYLPQLRPFFQSAFKLAIGMSFKSGIAAEVIGQPLHTMGNGLYLAKVYLETGELFAWTIVIVLISFICEKILALATGRAK